eukprot:5990509-Prymnesium_polylepis.2
MCIRDSIHALRLAASGAAPRSRATFRVGAAPARPLAGQPDGGPLLARRPHGGGERGRRRVHRRQHPDAVRRVPRGQDAPRMPGARGQQEAARGRRGVESRVGLR